MAMESEKAEKRRNKNTERRVGGESKKLERVYLRERVVVVVG